MSPHKFEAAVARDTVPKPTALEVKKY